jgi:bla regulator protein blaR1
MTTFHLWNSMTMHALITHLWQSTAFAVLVWLLTLALRNYPARARFSVWMAASIKFLMPFGVLTALGSRWTLPNIQPPIDGALYTVIEKIDHPFASSHLPAPDPGMPLHTLVDSSRISIALAGIWLCGCIVMLIRWTWQWQIARRLVNEAAVLNEGREVDALRQAEARARIRKPIPVIATSRTVEPGIFGLMRPVLIWPAGLSQRLDDAHIASIVAHEFEHVRRHDNLIAAFHSLVEAVFWFHPLVWWMGKKMTEERERACDEWVLEQNVEPQTYADSILKVCAFCLESPLVCVAGVSSSDLRKRIIRITSDRSGLNLSFCRRALLIVAALMAITLPIGFGVVRGQSAVALSGTQNSAAAQVPRFDVISIKPTGPGDDRTLFQLPSDAISFHGSPIRIVLENAFGVEDDRILGAPSWVNTNRYDIEAKVSPEDAPKLDKLKGRDRDAMLIPMLTERFNLRYHHETRELQVYALMVAKSGPKLIKGEPLPPGGPKPADGAPVDPAKEHFRIMSRPGHIEADSVPMEVLADPLTRILGHQVVDKTGLVGNYNFTLQWTPENPLPPTLGAAGTPSSLEHAENANDAANVSLFTAIQEQLGLKLESEKSSVDVIVIDHIDPPSPN